MVSMHGGKADEALHEPKSAAGILPADVLEKSTAGKMPAAHRAPFDIRISFVIGYSSLNDASSPMYAST